MSQMIRNTFFLFIYLFNDFADSVEEYIIQKKSEKKREKKIQDRATQNLFLQTKY